MYPQFQEIPRIVLIACGSFSPPTVMHLRIFEIARDHIEMTGGGKVIGGIISPVHDSYGKKGLAPATHRLAMLKLSLKSSNWIKLSDWECNQSQWTRTRQTLQYHQNYMNNLLNEINDFNPNTPGWLPDNLRERNDPVKLKLLCGADLLESFSVPGLWSEEDIEDIVGNFGMVVISRGDSNPEKIIFDSDILTKYQTNITIVRNWIPNEVSSSMIRRLLKRGQSVKYLIDDLVITYIQAHGLYDVKILEYNIDNHQKNLISNRNFIIENYINEIDLKNSNLSEYHDNKNIIENMDETDYALKSSKTACNNKLLLDIRNSTNNVVFCCKGNDNNNTSDNSKFTLNCPGQAVKIITNPLHNTQERKQEHRIFELNKANAKKLRLNQQDNDVTGIDNLVQCDKEAVNFI